MEIEFILYVKDQKISKEFYEQLLEQSPILDVPGMTSFQINESTRLGLMPEEGIAKIITPILNHPKQSNGTPRCELYLKVENLSKTCSTLDRLGATLVSPTQMRSWGVEVAYYADPDTHVIALF